MKSRRKSKHGADTPASARSAPAGVADSGAPPTNRAPYNCTDTGFKPLRYGIDSLYLSYAGKLNPDWDQRLTDKKLLAQSEESSDQALAQVQIGKNLFEVTSRGQRPFAYTLVDNCFFIQVSRRKAESIPLIYAQISSEFLAAVGVEAAEVELRFVANTIGLVEGVALVSRADPFLDFVCDFDLDRIQDNDWIYRAHVMSRYRHRRRLSGFDFGRGGDLSARLYDKTLEIEVKSHKYYVHDLWKQAGWDGVQTVWRPEFQARRGVLKQLGIHTVPGLQEALPSLWQYLTEDWLRLTIPSVTDLTKSRWPNHPLWDAISGIYAIPIDQPKLKRFTPARLPYDPRLFQQGLGYVSAYMASKGIEDWGEGLGEFLANMKLHFDIKGRKTKTGFFHQLEEKLRAKGRLYNTIRNRAKDGSEEAEIAKRAEAYRKAKDGGDEDT
ncbi:MAG: hypothetical protein Q8K18_18720 [Burkholderiales bacterium]|nr:hypothetical protein [Burkholderiales bacterium]